MTNIEMTCKYPCQSVMSRPERLALADGLLGKQLWFTHRYRGQNWIELQEPECRNVQYVTLLKDGRILLNFKDFVVSLRAYGDKFFDTKERAEAELRYINRRNNQ